MVDTIAGNASTTATISVGGSVTSTIDTIGDHDWFRITLTAGQAITVSLNGGTLSDPYLRILDASGNVIFKNDDFGGLNSQISFQATQSGTYYIDAAAWADPQNPNASYPGVTGDYQLNVTAWTQPPVWTNDQIAQQLVSGYWGDGMHRFVLDQTRTITVNISGISDLNGQNLALTALQQWSSITGINFVQTSGAAQITFTDNDPAGGAFTDSNYSGANISDSHVNIDAGWLSTYGSSVGGYAYQAYLHEIGHALGLGHAGNYNTTANYPYDALYQNDAWSTSVMSYFSQTENTYFKGQGFDDAYLVTPMVADILAMQQMYGLSTTTRNGDTTYGFNSNAGNPYNAAVLFNVAYTIFDTGGTDTMDYSGFDVSQVINLNPESFSSVGTPDGNVSIARGTIIENAIGGSWTDTIIGNSVANILTGGDGTDTLTGGIGNDTFRDTKAGLSGDTITDFSLGDKIVITDASLAGFSFSLTGNTLTYTGGSLTLLAPFNGTIVASSAVGGGVQLSLQAGVDARNDFNGGGRSDILWRNVDGRITDWLGATNGGFVDNLSASLRSVQIDWTIASFGDFNGDGRDDILWRNTDGRILDWLGMPNGSFSDNIANSLRSVGNEWEVTGTGDFNGDGRDDILWRNTDGRTLDWLGMPSGSFSDNISNSLRSVATDWQVAGIGDFNGDGRDDILWRNSDGRIVDWLGSTDGGFADNIPNSLRAVATEWQIASIGDFNGDSYDDILWRNSDGRILDWLGTANGGFADNNANSYRAVSIDWKVESVGDYNGDGRDDILWRHDDGRTTNWLGTVNGGFADNLGNAYFQVATEWHVQPDNLI